MKVSVLFAAAMSIVLVVASALGRESQILPQEVPWTGKQPLSDQPVVGGKSLRGWLEATVFPEFVYAGTLEGAIDHLMSESRKFSPGGLTAGGFLVRGIEMDRIRVNVRLRGRNVLELVDALCALSRCNWTLSPYSIMIHREPDMP